MFKKAYVSLLRAGLIAVAFSISNVHAGLDFGKALGAAVDATKAATLSDQDVKSMALQFRKHSDKKNKLAPSGNPYAQRLVKITSGLSSEDGLKLDFKVYLSKAVNAFALADGTIRVYSGLMDLMTDDEVRFVIGHEIAHVKLGHSKAAIKTAYLASAARKGLAASSNSKVSTIAESEIGDLVETVVNAQHSQSQESESDAYSVKFMKKHKYDTKAAASSLRKLAKLSGNEASILSSHPAPGNRAEAVEKLAAAK